MDLVLANLRIPEAGPDPVDVGVAGGRIAAVAPGLAAARPPGCEAEDFGGRLAVPGFVEAHVHLDKACLLDRCAIRDGTLAEAIRLVAAAKRGFTVEDVAARGARALEAMIAHGTTRLRTHVEVDPRIGLTGFEGVRRLARDYAWAVDMQLCVFPQEGLLNDPGTEELLVEALGRGADLIGACPYTDTDPLGQIDRIFAIARETDVDIDLHLDFDVDPEGMTLWAVCDAAERIGWQGRVAVGHATKLSALPPARLADAGARLRDAGVALTVLPSTDLFLTGRHLDHDVVRGVAPAHRLMAAGVECALSTNNLLNPFTPFGDGSLVRMANLFANVAQLGRPAEWATCLEMVTARPARMLNLADYGIRPGNPADLVVLDAVSSVEAVTALAPPLAGYKRGRRTFTRQPAVLHRPAGP